MHTLRSETFFNNWKPFKNNQKCFLFHLKSSFRSQDILIFVLNFWACRKNGFIRKIRLISKFMTLQPGKQTIEIHISPNISRSKGNQTMKFGQSIEYNMRIIFLEKSYTKCDVKTISRTFSKIYFWINSLKFYDIPSWGLSEYIKQRCRPLTFTSDKAF